MWIAWLVIAIVALSLLGRMVRWFTFWLWVQSVKGPKERMEAEILWRTWRQAMRRK